MQTLVRTISSLVVVLIASTLAACGGASVAQLPVTGSRTSQGNSTGAAAVTNAALVARPAKSIAGTYVGTVLEVEGSKQRSGDVTIAFTLNGSKIAGTFAVTFGSKTTTLDIAGTAKKAKLTFTIEDPSGCNALAHAKVKRGHLNGTAQVPSCKGQPVVSISYKTKKQKK
jgi:hypothetical protein